ncbi:hypothetical protein SAMN05421841_3487 [Chryseobacterium wanjuense]|uniref:Uncharacterized protein n=1 Tax=Chryseobacterium wanjuense TaxID=356305 RepID=A0A1I0S011_9FLAO|nr:hypothetical protein [Chryseobacterium wanjuense]SEW47291.1 hypothetical protein SAMN05421841_3487 [Chryseobacterium wanjuense]
MKKSKPTIIPMLIITFPIYAQVGINTDLQIPFHIAGNSFNGLPSLLQQENKSAVWAGGNVGMETFTSSPKLRERLGKNGIFCVERSHTIKDVVPNIAQFGFGVAENVLYQENV